jgi:hypothetical protein
MMFYDARSKRDSGPEIFVQSLFSRGAKTMMSAIWSSWFVLLASPGGPVGPYHQTAKKTFAPAFCAAF